MVITSLLPWGTSMKSTRVFLIILSLLAPTFVQAQEQSFADFLIGLRVEARNLGISEDTINAAFSKVEEPLPRILELDRSQPEFVQTFAGYMRNRMSQARINRGQALLVEHKDLFSRIQAEYDIQPHYLASFWALESNFGDFTGGFSVINALATLAYDPRRRDMFRRELLTSLQIIEDGHIAVDQMLGSWAGAMGQCQFMPSTFYTYARDGDGDGRIDIWNSIPDVFASAANFLSQSGWKGDERWGREVTLPTGFDFTQTGTSVRKSVTDWGRLGVTRIDGASLGASDIEGSIVLPAGAKGPVFLAYNNFRTTMVWNRSAYYAISVGHLADRFVGGGPIINMPSDEERPLTRNEVIELQEILNGQGIDVGAADGILGSGTRAGVRAYQLQAGLPTDGYANFELLESMREL
jgi:membrane-bound lytic murein transglycosylase B